MNTSEHLPGWYCPWKIVHVYTSVIALRHMISEGCFSIFNIQPPSSKLLSNYALLSTTRLLMFGLCGFFCFSDLQMVQVQKTEKVNLVSKFLIVVPVVCLKLV